MHLIAYFKMYSCIYMELQASINMLQARINICVHVCNFWNCKVIYDTLFLIIKNINENANMIYIKCHLIYVISMFLLSQFYAKLINL